MLNDDLALRVYTSRLLGQDPSLVLHGGGNTSVKITEKHFGRVLPKVFELSKQMSDEMKAIENKEVPVENK